MDTFGNLSGAPAIAGVLLTSLTVYLASDWRLSLTALLVQYLLVGLALTRYIQGEVAVVKVLAGVLVVSVLYLTARRVQEEQGPRAKTQGGSRSLGLNAAWGSGPLGLPLRLLTVVLLFLGIVRLFNDYQFPLVAADIAFAASWMAGIGMLGLVLSGSPMRVAPAVLTILAGFDLIYGGLEPSLAVAGFWCAVTLLSSVAFCYLGTVHSLAEGAEETGKEATEA